MPSARAGLSLGLLCLPGLLGTTATAVAQGLPPCAPEKTGTVSYTTTEKGAEGPLVATHDEQVHATFPTGADRTSVSFPAAVRVIAGSDQGAHLVVPSTPTLAVTAAWEQPKDPADAEGQDDRCAAASTTELPVTPARRGRAVQIPIPGDGTGFLAFAVIPSLELPDLSPLEISVRIGAPARFPPARAKARTMTVPMGPGELVKYAKRLPTLFYASVPVRCRLWYLTCGRVFTRVSRLTIDDAALERGVEKGDLDTGHLLLARSQPFREYASLGVRIELNPGGRKPKPTYGYDVQVRQSGRLVARVRRVVRCRTVRKFGGTRSVCRAVRASNTAG